ncbi:glycosyltransferase, partial [Turicibacter sanguinis]|nr:glycosyltransferase [Turicibacter sanguinis]
MNLDIIFVTYNSQKWIDNCFKSIHESEYDLKQLNLIIVDNNSQDDTVKKLNHIKEQTGNDYGDFKIIESKENLGFGKGNNLGFEGGTSPYVLFLNIDTEVENNTFSELEKEIISSNEKIGAWELRQFPYEHPKFYNPVTEYTSWSSGAALVVRRDLFEKIGGFDKNIFMYAEDVDLSWRIRCEEYYLKYCPKAVVNHYSYEGANQVKPTQYYNSIIN